MSGFKQHEPQIKGVKNCHECNKETKQDIFVIDYGRKKKRDEPGLTECVACMDCKIIYEVIA